MKRNTPGGYIAFTSLLIISSVALAIAASISLLGVGEAKSSLDFKKGAEVLKVAEGCLEEALIRLRNDEVYLGGTLDVGNGTCAITVGGGVNLKTIDISASITGPPDYVKRLSISVERLGGSVNLTSWSQVE